MVTKLESAGCVCTTGESRRILWPLQERAGFCCPLRNVVAETNVSRKEENTRQCEEFLIRFPVALMI